VDTRLGCFIESFANEPGISIKHLTDIRPAAVDVAAHVTSRDILNLELRAEYSARCEYSFAPKRHSQKPEALLRPSRVGRLLIPQECSRNRARERAARTRLRASLVGLNAAGRWATSIYRSCKRAGGCKRVDKHVSPHRYAPPRPTSVAPPPAPPPPFYEDPCYTCDASRVRISIAARSRGLTLRRFRSDRSAPFRGRDDLRSAGKPWRLSPALFDEETRACICNSRGAFRCAFRYPAEEISIDGAGGGGRGAGRAEKRATKYVPVAGLFLRSSD